MHTLPWEEPLRNHSSRNPANTLSYHALVLFLAVVSMELTQR